MRGHGCGETVTAGDLPADNLAVFGRPIPSVAFFMPRFAGWGCRAAASPSRPRRLSTARPPQVQPKSQISLSKCDFGCISVGSSVTLVAYRSGGISVRKHLDSAVVRLRRAAAGDQRDFGCVFNRMNPIAPVFGPHRHRPQPKPPRPSPRRSKTSTSCSPCAANTATISSRLSRGSTARKRGSSVRKATAWSFAR